MLMHFDSSGMRHVGARTKGRIRALLLDPAPVWGQFAARTAGAVLPSASDVSRRTKKYMRGDCVGEAAVELSETADIKWRLREFSFTGRLRQGQSGRQWVTGSWHDSWGWGRVLRVRLLLPLSPRPCHRSIRPVDTVAPLCFGVWNWTEVFRSTAARLSVFAGTVLHPSHWSVTWPAPH